MDRRDALRMIAAGTAGAAAAGCAKGGSGDAAAAGPTPLASKGPESPQAAEASPAAAQKPVVHAPDAVQAVERLTGPPWQTLDPFLFCVHHRDAYPEADARMAPRASLAGRNIGSDFSNKDGWSMYHGDVVPGFPRHPHRGFETVTVVRTGLLDHADSMGAAARYGGGDVQWLTAGKGIQHAEMFPLLDQEAPNPVELFQIWLNLPRARKMAEPHFTMLWADSIPKLALQDAAGRSVEVSLFAGRLGEHAPPAPPPESWASQADADVAIWTVKLAASAEWTLPAAKPGTNRALYFFHGTELHVAGKAVAGGQRVVLRPDVDVQLQAGEGEVEVLLLQGRPIGEPVAKYGPFVMNTRQEIQQAFADYRSTQFGGWVWDSDAPVHGRESRRFARRPDGSVEEPA